MSVEYVRLLVYAAFTAWGFFCGAMSYRYYVNRRFRENYERDQAIKPPFRK